MNGPVTLIDQIGAVATAAASVVARRLAFYAVIGGLLALAAGFAIAAGWTALNAVYGSMIASLVVAGGAVAVVLLALLSDHLVRRARSSKAALHAAKHPAPQPMAPILAQTFVAAMQMGRSLRR